MKKSEGLPKISIPSDTELNEADLISLCKDQAIVDEMARALITPRMRREFRKELDDAAKRGYRRIRD